MYDIATVGSATEDVFIATNKFKIQPNQSPVSPIFGCLPIGEKIEVDNIVFDSGGGATNTAVSCARFGLKTACLTKVGADVAGEELIRQLKKEKVAASFIQKSTNKHTSFSVVLTHPGQDRTILVYRGAASDLKFSDLPLDKITTKWFYLSSLGKKVNLFEQIINYGYHQRIKIALNPGQEELKLGLKKFKKIGSKINVLILNKEEAEQLLPIKDISELLASLYQEIKTTIAITDGANGAYVYDGQNKFYAPATKNKLVNSTGAGDAFGSALIAGLILKNDLKYALQLAILNSGSVITKIGAKNGLLKTLPTKLPNTVKAL